jgi:site-specific DNA-methyltransferase (adenine-specific)
MFAFVGDTVLDPFLGSGTTSLAAKNLNRNSIGYEINKDFIPVIKEKLYVNQMDLSETTYEFLIDHSTFDSGTEIQKLPYIFHDPQGFDRKIDPKKLQFGSRIDKNDSIREEYFSVKEVLSPELILLDNNLTIRLLGVKESPKANGQAINFIENKTKGQKVFIKYDKDKFDDKNHMSCYLYLKNKTFINAHLIKIGLAIADRDINYRYRNRFIQLEEEANA